MPKLIIFVCLGNICRSPLAEAVFIKKLGRSIGIEINVLSAATSDWNIGDGADERSIKVALQYEYTAILDHRAKKLSPDHLDSSEGTMIICMDRSNKQNVHKLLGNAGDRVSVHLFSDFGGDVGMEVPDPYYGDISDFENVLIQCERYADELISFILRESKYKQS